MSTQTKKRSPWRKRILFSLLVLAVITAGIYWYVATDTYSDTKDRKPAYIVSAFDFINEFRQNEKIAKEKYNNKILLVNGRVSAIEPADTTMNVKFVDTGTGDYIIFTFQQQHVDEAKTIKVGDSVSIKAAYRDFIYSEILDAYSIMFQRSTLNK
ncbi:MAG TPA: hypothetical protein VIZ28_11985 [Chitinophagaceae bacterium]